MAFLVCGAMAAPTGHPATPNPGPAPGLPTPPEHLRHPKKPELTYPQGHPNYVHSAGGRPGTTHGVTKLPKEAGGKTPTRSNTVGGGVSWKPKPPPHSQDDYAVKTPASKL
ncbi:hypothetical protein BYT27DRAFT_7181748 [Phlegmacium glaucopus]|nr:hypothetical protein BYT27DRAFT_7181748 [Phlegmacium glaucopus]